MNWYVFVISKN